MPTDDEQPAITFGRVLGALEQGFKDLGQRIADLQTLQGSMVEKVNAISRKMVEHEERIGAVETAIQAEKQAEQQADEQAETIDRERRQGRREVIFGVSGLAIGLATVVILYVSSIVH